MRLIDLRNWIDTLPEDIQESEMVFRELVMLPPDPEENCEEFLACTDKKVVTVLFDTDSEEIVLLDAESLKILDDYEKRNP